MNKAKYWKHPTYSHVYCPSLPTPIGKMVWVYLTKPKDPPPPQPGQLQGAPRYEVSLLIPKKTSKDWVAEIADLASGALDVFNDKKSAKLSLDFENVFGKYGDGDTGDLEKYPFYKGCWVLAARNASLPKIVGPDRKPISPGEVVGGMTGKFVVTPLITAHGLSFKLDAVQFIKDDGTRYGGAQRDPVELFEACEDQEEAEETETEETTTKTVIAAKAGKTKKGKEAAVDLL